jgi:uncharacterized protein
MTIEIVPTYSCPVGCTYCYWQASWNINPNLMRKVEYDIDLMIDSWEKLSKKRNNKQAVFHGGEPLLIPINDLWEICNKLKEKGCTNFGIQTSTYNMSDEHIKLFKAFNFSVGISFDGPWVKTCPKCLIDSNDKCPNCGTETIELDLNRGRGWIFNPKMQKEFTQKTIYWIDRLHAEGISVGTITVLNRFNAGDDLRLNRLLKFYLERKWLNVRFNPVHEDMEGLKWLELSEDRYVDVYLKIAQVCLDNGMHWEPIRDMQNAILGISLHSCWHASQCDATNTTGATFVNGQGEYTVCPKLSSKFKTALQNDLTHNPQPWRPNILKQIPIEYGGCKGCRYFYLCQGGCEADGYEGDIRNRTRMCKWIYALYQYLENRIKNEFPSIRTFPDLPITEQERRFKYLISDSNENYSLIKNIVRLNERNEFKSVEYAKNEPTRVKVCLLSKKLNSVA